MPEPDRRMRSMRIKFAISAGAVLGAVGIAYAADVLSSRGEVPRGVAVAGVAVGGLDTDAAEASLRRTLTPRAGDPIDVRAGDVASTVNAGTAGLRVDWPGTLAQAGAQPLNPLTRLRSFFGTREVGIVTTSHPALLARAVENVRSQTDRAPVEGAVSFTGATPVAVVPRAGQVLDVPGAASALLAGWAHEGTIELPVQRQEVTVTPDGLDAAMTLARAAAADVVVQGQGSTARLAAKDVGSVLRFVPDGRGGLAPITDADAATDLLAPQLAATEKKPADATVVLRGGAPQVLPSNEGVTIDWTATLGDVTALLTGSNRSVPASYVTRPAAFSTGQAQGLGIKEVIGEFRTGGFSSASGVNIRQVAREVTGALVKPGDTFSLNGYTGTRGRAQGYVESGIIIDGHAGTAVGGGISQFATTLFNGSYFAGMTDVTHQEHSYYISRYPAAREATVYEGAIDLKFSVPTTTGVLIEAFADSSSVTVRVWGTKTVNVESITGGRSSYTSPKTITLPQGKNCSPSGGAQGFTTSDTRVVRDAATGQEIYRKTRTVTYDPSPIVRCA